MPTCRLYVGNLPKDRAVNLSCLAIFELTQSLIPETVHRWDACNCGSENLFWPKPLLNGNSTSPLQLECWRHVQRWVRYDLE